MQYKSLWQLSDEKKIVLGFWFGFYGISTFDFDLTNFDDTHTIF